jgi:hypothetical protein
MTAFGRWDDYPLIKKAGIRSQIHKKLMPFLSLPHRIVCNFRKPQPVSIARGGWPTTNDALCARVETDLPEPFWRWLISCAWQILSLIRGIAKGEIRPAMLPVDDTPGSDEGTSAGVMAGAEGVDIANSSMPSNDALWSDALGRIPTWRPVPIRLGTSLGDGRY